LLDAQKSAELILMIDAEEQIQSFDQQISLVNNIDVGLVDIIHTQHTTRSPRLFRSGSLPQFKYPIGDHLVIKNKIRAAISGFSFFQHGHGVHDREQYDTLTKRF
jgi:hypothetical protein